ncbi:MAG: acetate--CoA ligase family protein [Planctomycetes bacterium]|nr:acetate--CoA ligase family protein [Planctomycetota bacterium]
MTALTTIFAPKSIALVGASENPEKVGHILLKNILDSGFTGEVYPVGASTVEVLGRRFLGSVREVPKGVDLVLLTVRNETAPQALKEAAALGPKAIVVLASGYGDGPLARRKLEKEVAAIRAQGVARVLGPNAAGIYDAYGNVNASYFPEVPRARGNVSFICQSPAYASVLFHEMRGRGLGLSKFACIGAPLDLDPADFLDFLGRDERTEVIALVLEEIKDGGRFLRTAAEVCLKKPVVVFKTGGAAPGPLVREADIFRSASRQAGILIGGESESFFDTISVLSCLARSLPESENACLLTVSGTVATTALDLASDLGLQFPRLDPATRKALEPAVPTFASLANPVDLTTQVDPTRIGGAIDTLFADRRLSGFVALDSGWDREELGRALAEARRKYAKPVVAFCIGAPQVTQALVGAGIPVFPTPERAIRAYHSLVTYRKLLESLKRKGILQAPAPHPPVTGKGKAAPRLVALAEHETKEILAAAGVAVTPETVTSRLQDADELVRKVGYPLVLKVVSAKIQHRSEVGGIVLNIQNRKALDKGFLELRKQFKKEPILVQRQVAGVLELIVGARRDPVFGPFVCFGVGGVLTDLLRDFSVRLCPVRKIDADTMIQEIRGAPVLNGYHNIPAVDPPQLVAVLVKISELMLAHPEIQDLEINPLIITAEGPVVANARAQVLR